MGTRHLTIVIQESKYKVVQYGQWDGYPTGQGLNLVEILNKIDLDEFKKKVSKLTVISEDEIGEIIDSINSKEDEIKFSEYHGDTGTSIIRLIMLDKIYQNKVQLWVNPDGEPYYQEWNYIIDLDKDTLEIFNRKNSKGIYSLNDLPDMNELKRLKRLESIEDEDEE